MSDENLRPDRKVIFHAFLALLSTKVSVDPLVKADFAIEVKKNTYFKDTAEERAKYKPIVINRLQMLRRNFIRSFVLLTTATLFALFVLHLTSNSSSSWLGITSVFFLAWSTLARLGYSGQSIGHDTAVEHLDESIFKVLFWLGTFLGILAMG